MKHKHAELIKAWAEGAQIEYKRIDGVWRSTTSPSWNEEVEYRIYDKWRKEKEAFAKGALIEFRCHDGLELNPSEEWTSTLTPGWFPHHEYRIKKPAVQYYVTITEDDGKDLKIIAHNLYKQVDPKLLEYVSSGEDALTPQLGNNAIVTVSWPRSAL